MLDHSRTAKQEEAAFEAQYVRSQTGLGASTAGATERLCRPDSRRPGGGNAPGRCLICTGENRLGESVRLSPIRRSTG